MGNLAWIKKANCWPVHNGELWLATPFQALETALQASFECNGRWEKTMHSSSGGKSRMLPILNPYIWNNKFLGGFTSHFIFLLFLECLHSLQIWWMLLGSWIPRILNDRQGSFLSEMRLLPVTWSDLNRAYLRSVTSHWPLGLSDVQPWTPWLTKYDFTFSKVKAR